MASVKVLYANLRFKQNRLLGFHANFVLLLTFNTVIEYRVFCHYPPFSASACAHRCWALPSDRRIALSLNLACSFHRRFTFNELLSRCRVPVWLCKTKSPGTPCPRQIKIEFFKLKFDHLGWKIISKQNVYLPFICFWLAFICSPCPLPFDLFNRNRKCWMHQSPIGLPIQIPGAGQNATREWYLKPNCAGWRQIEQPFVTRSHYVFVLYIFLSTKYACWCIISTHFCPSCLPFVF